MSKYPRKSNPERYSWGEVGHNRVLGSTKIHSLRLHDEGGCGKVWPSRLHISKINPNIYVSENRNGDKDLNGAIDRFFVLQ